MKGSKRARKLALATVLAVLGAVVAASSAQAYSFSIGVTGPSSMTVGQTALLDVSGQNPTPDYPDYYWFSTWLSVDVIDGGIVAGCPATQEAGKQLALATGGDYLVFAQREPVDWNGAWSVPVGYTPGGPGKALICAYSDDGSTNTLAKAQAIIDVRAPGATGAGTGTGSTTGARKACKKPKRRTAAAARKCRKRR
jgi:hypothetical protein